MQRRIIEGLPFIALILFFPAWFAVHGLANNYSSVPFPVILALFTKYLLLSAVLYFLFYLLFKNPVKAAAAFFLTSLLYYSFGYFHDVLVRYAKGMFFSKYSFMLPALVVIYALGIILIWKKTRSLKWIRVFNLLLLIWIIIDVIQIIREENRKPSATFAVSPCKDCSKPDVHLIVIDGYAGYDQLKDEFNFDNGAFLDSLRSLGFVIPAVSRSDYARTEFSMASMLNMNYDTLRDLTVTPETLKYCGERIARNEVVQVFKKLGYNIVNNSIFDMDGQEAPVTNSFLLNGRQRIERATLAGRIENDIYLNFLGTKYPGSGIYRKYIYEMHATDSVIEKRLQKISGESAEPRFIYSHFLLTHFPYYYNAEGRFNSRELINLTNYTRKDLYLGNLQASNFRILKIVKDLISKSGKPPVILLVSDHGFRYGKPSGALSTLGAYYFPAGKILLPDTLNNVNVFRLLFKDLYQQNFHLLPIRR